MEQALTYFKEAEKILEANEFEYQEGRLFAFVIL